MPEVDEGLSNVVGIGRMRNIVNDMTPKESVCIVCGTWETKLSSKKLGNGKAGMA